MMKQIFTALVILFLIALGGCIQETSLSDSGKATDVPSPPTTPPEMRIETSYALLSPDEMIATVDAIFAGRITAVSPTQFKQNSNSATSSSTPPIFTVEMTVDKVFVDEIGLGETAVLTQVGSSPLAETSDWSLQVGDDIIAFVVQRRALHFSNAPADTYLLRQTNGHYASLPAASEPWPPMTKAEVAHRLAEIRPVLMEDGVSLRITTPEPNPTPAACTPLPEGMTMTVTQLTDTRVSLELTGLSPGESLHIIYRWDGIDGSTQIEDYDLPPVGENGRYSQTQNLRPPEAGAQTWQIKVIHSRGVACTEITLPPEETAVDTTTEPGQTFVSEEYGFSVQVLPGWTAVDTLPHQVSFVKQGTGIALRFGVMEAAEDINLVRTGVSAGDLVAREPLLFLGETIHSNALVYQDKVKAILYENAGEIPRGDLILVLTLEKSSSNYEAIDIPPDIQAEADAMVESAKFVPVEPLPADAGSDLALLYGRGGHLYRFDLDSLTVQSFDLPARGRITNATLNANGRYLAFSDENGLNLYDVAAKVGRLWLASTTKPWQQFRPRAWSQADYLLVQRLWHTESSTPGWATLEEDAWQSLPLPAEVAADFYGLDSGAVWSPDGAQVALAGYDYAIPSNVPGLTVINVETGTANRIVTRTIAAGSEGIDPLVAGAYQPAWSLDGEWLAFGLEEDAAEALNFPMRLYQVRPDGRDLTPLTGNRQGQASYPVWTAEGNLYYSQTNVSDSEDGIYLYDRAAQTHTRLIPGSNLAPLSLSTDGRFLAYRQTRAENSFLFEDLAIWSVDSAQTIPIAAGRDGDPAQFVGWLLPAQN